MSWIFSRALVEAYVNSRSLPAAGVVSSEENSSDGKPSAPSSLNLSAVSGLLTDKTTAYYRHFQSGVETLPLSTESRGEELLTWFREASHVRIFQAPILRLSEFPVRVQVSGNKCSESFAKLDRPSSLWKTHQCSLGGDLELFSATWPRWGMMRDGECWEQTTSADSTSERECLLWATPIKRDWKDSPGMATQAGDRPRLDTLPRQVFAFWPTVISSSGGSNTNSASVKERGHGKNLTGVVKFWPTPTVDGNHNRKGASMTSGNGLSTAVKQSGAFSLVVEDVLPPLNPDFAEWEMDWVVGWSNRLPLSRAEWDRWISSFDRHDVEFILCKDGKIRATRPGLCGMAENVPDRSDRLSAIGDGQVPICVFAAFQMLTT